MQKFKKKILNFVVKLCSIRQQASLEVYKHKYYCVQFISLDKKKKKNHTTFIQTSTVDVISELWEQGINQLTPALSIRVAGL